jgi:hypothetical protein
MTISRARRITSYGLTTLLWAMFAGLLVSCSQPGPRPAAASVSASEAALAAAGRVVLACYTVPRCSAAAPKAQIKAAYDSAYISVTQAQTIADAGGSPDLTATTAAMSVLQALVVQLPQATP